MPVTRPASLVWTCRACGFTIQNQPDNESNKQLAFSHLVENHGLVEENKDMFYNKFRTFYDIN